MSFFKKDEGRIFWPFYLALFIGIATPGIYVVQVFFFLARGFTMTQLGIGFGIAFLMMILSEVPTGAIADLFSKRLSVQLHWLMHTITTALFIFVQKPWHMYVLFAVEGVSMSMASGAFEALAYQQCTKNRRKDLINEFFGKISFVREVAHFISYFGTVVFLYLVGSDTPYRLFGMDFLGIDFLWLTGAVGFFLAFLVFFGVKDPLRKRGKGLKQHMIDTHRTGIAGMRYAKDHPVISKLFLASFFLASAFILFGEPVHQSFLIGIGFNAEKVALVIALASIVGAIFSLIPKAVEKRFRTEKHFIQFTVFIQLALLAGLFLFNKLFAYSLAFFFIYYNIHRSLRDPIFDPFKQLFMKDSMRATIGSVDSLLAGLARVIFFPIAGFLLDRVGAVNTTLSAAVPLVIALVVLYTIKMKERVSH